MALFPLGILSAAGAGGVQGDYELISSEILGSAQASVVFDVSSFASTYKHLQIRYVARTSRASVFDGGRLKFNGDTGANFDDHGLFGNGSSVGSFAQLNATTGINFGNTPGANATANVYAPGVIDILDSFSSTKNKVIRELSGVNSSSPAVALVSGSWRNTNAITTIAISPNVGPNWVAGSRFSLYGIRG
jgi:hypothetical protein